jgi:hypothetical protein
MAIVFVVTLLGGVGLLALNVWPGRIEDPLFGFLLSCLSVPFFFGWSLFLLSRAVRELLGKPEPLIPRRKWGLWSFVIMLAVAGLLWFNVPQRIAFRFYYSEFQPLVLAAPAGWRGEELGRRLGPYWVDRYGADPRGGVFFRTHTGPDGIGPDELSYGFAFQPNPDGTPFGVARYRLHHLFGDWYAFAVSDD